MADEQKVEEKKPEELPQVEVTTGLRGWAGETDPTGIKGEKVQGGKISNVPMPYIAFDIECVLYVPEHFEKKVARLERFPVGYFNDKSKQYYKRVPGAINRLTDLLRYAYNIAIVYTGPKYLWKHRESMLEDFPYTTLICVDDAVSFKEQVALNEQVMTYYTLSAIKVEQSAGRGVLFVDWSSLGLEKR